MIRNKRWLATLLCLYWHVTASHATEAGGSNYLPGFYGDFAMAIFPGPGTYFNNFFAAYQDDSGQTGSLLEMPGILNVSSQDIVGGHYVAGLFPALMASTDTSSSNHQSRVALGDFYLVPAGISWKFDTVNLFVFEGVVAPTGRYRTDSFNTGRNYWTFDHNALMTWTLPADNELSMAIGYMNNLENSATHYQSGDEFHFDFNYGHYWGAFGAGLSGAYYRQTTADRAPTGVPIHESGEATSIGPCLLFIPNINGQDAALSVKWLHEIEVTGRIPQEYLIARLQLAF